MVTTVSTKKYQYAYLVLTFKGTDQEKKIWEALFKQNRMDLSIGIYKMVAREMPALEEASRLRQPRSTQTTHLRRMFLLLLPEYEHVIGFIQTHICRPAFKAHLKKLLIREAQSLGRMQNNPGSKSSPASVPANHTEARIEPAVQKTGKRSPQELFADPHKLISTIVRDLRKPETERLFVWDVIPPEDYPEAVRRAVPFGRLVDFWNATKNIV